MIWFPIQYIQIVGEDLFGEFSTSVTYAIAFAFFALSTFKQSGALRFFAVMLALFCFFVAGEEISWGQRIFGIQTPEILKEVNRQNEITLHNLDWKVVSHQRLVMGMGLLTISLLSALQKKYPVLHLHFPLPGPSLWPLFFVIGVLFVLGSNAPIFIKADEVSEMLLGILMLLWACDLIVKSFEIKIERSFVTATFIFAAVLSTLLVLFAGRSIEGAAWRYMMLALRDYPAYGMVDQSNQIIDFMIENKIAQQSVLDVKQARKQQSPRTN